MEPETHTAAPAPRPPLLDPGRNCWRVEHAQRFKLLIDADAYFSAVRAAIRQARHSVYILSWDIDSRTFLVPGGARDGYPEPLGEFLHAVVAERPQLQVCVLNWDFAMLYALEREWLPVYKLGWRRQRRLSFRMDARHPVGASHHQKVVVVDDKVAFVGGLDLTRCRWDTPEHAGSQPLRCDADGEPYGPFHDVQALVDGAAAAALGDLARTRWQRAGGAPVARADNAAGGDPWPAGLAPDLTDFDIGIARTEPAFNGAAGVYEVRQLYLDAIARARRSLFFENQYFTSNVLCNALAARLAGADAPEVMVVSPQNQSGWLEQATMGTLRARIDRRLKAADGARRYQMYCPQLAGLKDGCLNVHSKVFSVDDDVFCVGSANMSNRSMAFDTECNLVIEAHGDAQRQARMRSAIAGMRNRLLAEHLGSEPDTVAAALERHGLHGVVSALWRAERSMVPLDPLTIPEIDALTPEQAMFDPERPINADELVAQLVPADARKPVPRRMIGLGVLAAALALFALLWRYTPLRDHVNLASMIALARGLDALPFTPVAVIAVFVVAGMLMVPVTLLIAVSGVVFGPVHGALYAIVGSVLSSALGFGLGAWLGRDTVRHVLGHRVNRLSRRFAKRGILAMVVVRLLPVAPFTIVNVVAGASHLGLRDFLIGTFLGMTPGIVLTVMFSHHLAEAVRNPDLETMAVLTLLSALLIGMAFAVQRLFGRNEDAPAR